MFTNFPTRATHGRGLTLIELLMFVVIIGISLASILQVMRLTTNISADPQLRKQALAIAEGLLEEVELAHFTYCDPTDATADTATGAFIGLNGCTSILERVDHLAPEPAPVRSGGPYDNINDYVTSFGVAQASFDSAGLLVDANNSPLNSASGLSLYTATLMITPEVFGGIAAVVDATIPPNPANTNSFRITVTVSYNHGNDSVTLEGYRTRYAPTSLP